MDVVELADKQVVAIWARLRAVQTLSISRHFQRSQQKLDRINEEFRGLDARKAQLAEEDAVLLEKLSAHQEEVKEVGQQMHEAGGASVGAPFVDAELEAKLLDAHPEIKPILESDACGVLRDLLALQAAETAVPQPQR